MAYTPGNDTVQAHQADFFSPDVFSTKARALYKSYVVQVEKDLAELIEDLSNTNWHIKESYATDLKKLMAKYRAIAEQAAEPKIASSKTYENDKTSAIKAG